jgi:hypothetical protein
MLSEQERQELKAMAASVEVREEFRRLGSASRAATEGRMSVDHLLGFLTTMPRLSAVPPPKKAFVPYTDVRL